MNNLVLIPGLMCDERVFSPQIAGLSDRFSISVANLSGHSSIEDMASNFLDNSPSRFHLAGLSMGGIVAMEIYRQSPDRVQSLILMDTNHLAEREEIRVKRNSQISEVKAGNLQEVMELDLIPNYFVDDKIEKEIFNLCLEMALNLGEKVFELQSIALQNRRDQSDTMKSVNVPTLILCGEFDKLCPVERHKQLNAIILNSSLQILEGAGHLITLECASIVNKSIANFIDCR